MRRPIGYYVHHHGDGHRQRAIAIARAAGARITLLGTALAGRCPGANVIDLPDDRMSGDFDGRDREVRPRALHYAPIDHEGVRQRAAMIAGWIADARPALMIVDVSVEIAMLARLTSTPTVYVRLSGRRLDRAHLEAFRSAQALLAPFHEALEDDRTPLTISQRTFYAPGIVQEMPASTIDGGFILGVVGRGGGTSDGARWAEAARATPNLHWRVIGSCSVPKDLPSNLELRGWVENPEAMIAAASVVVGAAGDGLVGSVIAARRPFVCIPEPRPFAEQVSKASRLAALGAAIVLPHWPAPETWARLIQRAIALDPSALAALDAPDGARRVADWLVDMADGGVSPVERAA